MRENRLYGSEGGEAKSLPYPYLSPRDDPSTRSPRQPRSPLFSWTTRASGPRRVEFCECAEAELWIASRRLQ